MSMSKKRALDNFFTPLSQKKARNSNDANKSATDEDVHTFSNHATYPHPVAHLPPHIIEQLAEVPSSPGKVINDQPELDLLYFQPYIPPLVERDLFLFLRRSLFYYRVKYKIKRGPSDLQINTPRYTTVFGVDISSVFAHAEDGSLYLAESNNPEKPIPKDRYRTCKPRPIPECLNHLRRLTEIFTDAQYNFCLVNYYASGDDSISYHSDDEHFLGPNPSIASFSLGATRDFLLKHKPIAPSASDIEPKVNARPPLKLPLGSGDMVLMRGTTQANWLHSIPKRKGKGAEGGRINITFRRGIKPYATENYYQYNVGDGPVWKWDDKAKQMREWRQDVTVENTR